MWSCVDGVCSWVPGSGVPDLSCAADVPESPCSRMSATGAALAAASAVLGGSWAVLATARRVKEARVRAAHPNARGARTPARLGGRADEQAPAARPLLRPQVPPHVCAAWVCAGVALACLPFAWLVGPRVRNTPMGGGAPRGCTGAALP
jgi:hypothetical protein